MQQTVRLGYVFFLALVAALGGLLFGYDTAVISGTIDQVGRQFNLDVMNQGWYVGCALIGSNTVTTIIAMLIIDRVGRKKLIYYGVSGMIACLVLIAVYFAFQQQLGLSVYFMLTFFLLYVFCCAISISAVVFVLLSEMYPNNVRGLAMSIAGLALWIGTYLIGQLTPWMLATLSPAGTFVLFAVMCVPYMLIMWRLVPETAGMSLEDIERYWKRDGKKGA